MKRMVKFGLIQYEVDNLEKCETCMKSKMNKKPIHIVERKYRLLELVHFDICELNGMLTKGGNRYFITFIGDCSRYTYIYLLKHKDETFSTFKNI